VRVVHVSPTYFAPESFIGGGERYVEELSAAMSRRTDVRFVSFGPRAMAERRGPSYERVILRNRSRKRMAPFAPGLFRQLRDADVIHCYQYYTLPTFLAALYGRLRSKKVFVSDLGGGGWTPGYHIDQSGWITSNLPISEYAASRQPGKRRPSVTIYGGVDLARYPMRARLEHNGTVVFLGRILPHKGIHFLIQGMPAEMPLKVIGPIGDERYYRRLEELARGKRVQFIHGASDEEVRAQLRAAMALVHPTPVDARGDAGVNELFGLAVIEAMACGCVPIVSNAASLPEIVEHQRCGILVAPNDPAAIVEQLDALRCDATRWRELALGARQRVVARFTWEHVVERCLNAYGAG
jgi:glycosyltransferase involved in cell wall biosynthesis